MSKITASHIKKIKKYVKNLLRDGIPVDLAFHNYKTTKDNIEIIETLSNKINATDQQRHIAMIATYFLYTGYTQPEVTENYYTESAEIARTYLYENGFGQNDIDAVINCINTRAENTVPSTISEKIFHDMTRAYYGQKKIKSRVEEIWEERNFLKDDKVDYLTKLEDIYNNISNHEYHTTCAKRLYGFKKAKNLVKLQGEIDKSKKSNMLSSNKTAMTMFKTASRNHIDLINIADKKAGIMISINAIVITLMIPILGSYIIDVTKFIVPSIILILTCGTAIILATLATRPQLDDGEASEENIMKGNRSLFYFGNFFNMKKDEYKNAIKSVIVRDITLENSIINDLFDMGQILGIKYKRLRLCYIIFAVGIGLTLISFFVSFFIFPEI